MAPHVRLARPFILLALVLMLIVAVAPGSAATVFSNLSGTNATVGFTIGDLVITGRAVGFTVPAGGAYQLNSATLPLARITVLTNASATVSLYADSSGVPGSSIASLGTQSIPCGAPVLCTFSNYTFTSASGISLSGGTTYWLVVTGSNLNLRRTTAAFSGSFTLAGQKVTSTLVPSWQTPLQSGSFKVSLDADAPVSVTSITRAAASPTNTASVSWNVTLSGSVTGLTTSNFALATSGVSGATITGISGSGASYTVTASTGFGDGTIGLNLVNATNLVPGISTTLPFAGEVYTIDKSVPTTTISSTATSPTNVSPIPITVTFSESVTGFELADVSVGNGTAGNFSGSGPLYSFDVTPAAAGLVTVDVGNAVAQDSAGNNNVAATQFSITYDGTGPTAVITSTATDPTSTSPIPITITFSESVLGFDLNDVVITNGSASTFVGSANAVDFNVIPAGAGLVTVDLPADKVTDSTGNGNSAATQFSITYDSDAPGVTISSSASNPTNVSPIPITISFSEDVNGFDPGTEIVISNGTASNFAGTTSTVTFDLTPTTFGTVTVDVPAGVAEDGAGNPNTAAQFSIVYDAVGGNIIRITLMNDGTDAVTTIPNPVPASTPAFMMAAGSSPAATVDAVTGLFTYAFDPGAALGIYPATVTVTSGGQAFDQQVEITLLEAAPQVPLCEAHNFEADSVVRAGGMSDAIKSFINCRVLYANGVATSWLGTPMYSAGNLGVPGLMELGVLQAVDVFSPAGLTHFEGGAVFCVQGSGTLIWLAASGIPRHAEIVGSYTVPEFPGYTCVTLFEPGTLVLVSDNPMD